MFAAAASDAVGHRLPSREALRLAQQMRVHLNNIRQHYTL
jgi:hypothetical protein